MAAHRLIVSAVALMFTIGSISVVVVEAGIPIPGLQAGPTPFESIFATGFTGGYSTFGSGTTAGAIGNYGRFVSGGASSSPHGGGYGGRR